MDNKRLIKEAFRARQLSYAPYSGFNVGAAILCNNGNIYTGCNIENASYPVTICAERTALFKAVSEGEREFVAIAVAGGKCDETELLSDYAYPCGVCRQALYEFGSDWTVITAKSEFDYIVCSIKELLPYGFGPGNLK